MGARSSFVVHVVWVGLLACSVPRDGEVRLPDADPPGEAADLAAPPDIGAEEEASGVLRPPGSPGAPMVVSITPEEGQAVLEGTPIVITFSEPMDAASAQAAFTPAIAPAQPPLFSWSADKRVLTVDPGLSYPSGVDPAEVRPLTYAFTIGATATSLEQEPLPRPSSRSFTLKFRRIRSTHPFLQYAGTTLMSGNMTRMTTAPGTWLQVGLPAGEASHAFLTILIDALPLGLDIEAAVLRSHIQLVVGEPFRKLGNLRVREIVFNAVVPSLWQATPTTEPTGILFPSTSPAMKDLEGSVDVTAAVKADYANRIHGRNRSQFRLFFDGPPSADATNEFVRLWREKTAIEITYLIK